ncbi:MAG: hypothetical protein JW737_01165 [Acidobacteria bacterium]|nr:hypothetical protein [Acidobacteriota bacterium]
MTNSLKKLVAVVFTPILFDNGTDEAAVQRKAINKFIESGCTNWAIDIDWALFLGTDQRVVQALKDKLPGNFYLKLGNKLPTSWFTEAGKPAPVEEYFPIKLWEAWMSKYLARDLEKIIRMFDGRVKAVECGMEVSVESLWPFDAGKYYIEIQPALLTACRKTGALPILFNDTIHGDSINQKKSGAVWQTQIDTFFNYVPVKSDWEIGIHLYRHTTNNDWPEKYSAVRNYIYEKGYPPEKPIHITETGYDAYGINWLGCERNLLQAQANCWERHLKFTTSENSIGMTWMYCYWLPQEHRLEHAVLGPQGGSRPAFNILKNYWE